MTQRNPFNPMPVQLKRILAATVAIVAVCSYVSGLRDQVALPGSMSSEAVMERVQPVSHVQLAMADRVVR